MLTSVELDSQFQELTNQGKWREILNYRTSLTLENRSRYLWAWPSMSDLTVLKWMFEEFQLTNLLSVGCGSGLLEWILNRSIGLSVKGLEVDKSWWTSCYSPNYFIDLNFFEDDNLELEDIVGSNDFGLLFCYFNDHEAFNYYVDSFKGNWIVIIGPEDGNGRYTEPMALRPRFNVDTDWKLEANFSLVEGDIVAFYKRAVRKTRKCFH